MQVIQLSKIIHYIATHTNEDFSLQISFKHLDSKTLKVIIYNNNTKK